MEILYDYIFPMAHWLRILKVISASESLDERVRERTMLPGKTWTPSICKCKSKFRDNKTTIQHTRQKKKQKH